MSLFLLVLAFWAGRAVTRAGERWRHARQDAALTSAAVELQEVTRAAELARRAAATNVTEFPARRA